jgi:alkyldihydroxyacetonephosphate synthase
VTPATSTRRLKFWGWGYEHEWPSRAELERAVAGFRSHLGFEPYEPEQPARLEDIALPAPRLSPPRSLEPILTDDRYERVTHAYGRAYRDVVRAFRGRVDHPPDLVARPRDERDVEALLAWCADAGAAAIPFGGGTSVVGGVEPRLERSAVSIDMRALDRVLEVDRVSQAARIQAGVLGPALEEQLRPDGLTLRHFPQSFEFSTLGGWLATRSGGHFATRATHIDDFVESIRAVTPSGIYESRRLPGSGAGPSPDRLLLGSEGTLGIITEAWMRLRRRPRFRASASVAFDSFEQACAAARALGQGDLWPTNCRVLDADEAALTGVAREATLLLGFESADHPVEVDLDRALKLAGDHAGRAGERRGGERDEQSATWRTVFLRAPYVRDTFVAGGIVSETFETAITWRDLDELVAQVRARLADTVADGRVSCRLTHVYPDGAAPYFTVIAPARRGGELEQWDEIKRAASDAISAAGATITHHHAVGRDHRPWYDRQRPEPFALALAAAKRALDPAGVLNPGVLVDA